MHTCLGLVLNASSHASDHRTHLALQPTPNNTVLQLYFSSQY